MKTADFDFHLPEELIAQHPADQRDGSRMLVLNRSTGSIRHEGITSILQHLAAGDALVVNNTRVIPARTEGTKETGGRVECLFVEPESDKEWWVMMKSSHRPKPGARIELNGGLELEVLENRLDGLNRVKVEGPNDVLTYLDAHGEPPLPPYIKREHLCEDDPERYQTVYAKHAGAVAAPTAGLHFTPALLERIRDAGVHVVELTLHVGPGTFRPVKCEEVEEHTMDEERYDVTEDAADILNQVRSQGGRIVAVGSTSVRTLETVVDEKRRIHAGQGRSGLFIHPPFTFRAVDAILTNFHLPKSTLLMMMSAFVERETLLAAYRDAVTERYRFFSYGDCMLMM